MIKISFLCGISNRREPVLIPNSCNGSVAEITMAPCLFVSEITANLFSFGLIPLETHDTFAKKL